MERMTDEDLEVQVAARDPYSAVLGGGAAERLDQCECRMRSRPSSLLRMAREGRPFWPKRPRDVKAEVPVVGARSARWGAAPCAAPAAALRRAVLVSHARYAAHRARGAAGRCTFIWNEAKINP